MAASDLIIVENPSDADKAALQAALRAYNEKQVSPLDQRPIAILIQTDGVTTGGLSGRTGYDWMFVEYLVVPDVLRGTGVGTRLIQQAEQIARDRGCTGIWLDTFSFQGAAFTRSSVLRYSAPSRTIQRVTSGFS